MQSRVPFVCRLESISHLTQDFVSLYKPLYDMELKRYTWYTLPDRLYWALCHPVATLISPSLITRGETWGGGG